MQVAALAMRAKPRRRPPPAKPGSEAQWADSRNGPIPMSGFSSSTRPGAAKLIAPKHKEVSARLPETTDGNKAM